MNGVVIPVITQYDGKGFKQAEKGLNQLTKSTAKFLGSLALAHKAQKAMLSYIADEKATKVLAQNLKNLNLAYAIPSAEEFIKNMQKQTGILDDELRPAYAQLARVTGSTIESQKLMALAFDVSSGTGQDYASVIDALSQAYVGNNKGLKSLNIGLTQADLKTKSFAEITAILNKQFAGSGNASLDSYAGKMALLQVAASDASETIGKGLLDAISEASGPNGFPAFIKGIETAARLISDLATGTGRLIALFDIGFSPSKGFGDWVKKYRALRNKWDQEDKQIMKEREGIANNTSSYFEKQAKDSILAAKIAKTQKNLAAQRLATEKKLTAEKAAQAALDKANATLNAANNVFDIERIGVAAAMANQTLTDNERKRLEIKQAIFALEDAIDSKDTARITSATSLLNGLLGQFAVMQKQAALLDSIKAAFNALGVNKDLINIANLQEALRLLQEMAKITINGVKTGTSGGAGGAGGAGGGGGGGGVNTGTGLDIPKVSYFEFPKGTEYLSGADLAYVSLISDKERLNAALSAARYTGQGLRYASSIGMNIDPSMYAGTLNPAGTTVNVNIAGDLKKLIDSITFETQNASANGTPIALDRNATNLAW